MDIAHKVEETLVPYVVDEDIATTTHLTQIPTRRPIQREAVQVVEVVVPPEVQNLAGHEQVRQFFIHPLRCWLSRPSGAQ